MKNIVLFFASLFLVANTFAQVDAVSEEISKIENGLLPRLVEEGAPSIVYSLEERMKELNVPGVSIAVVKDGKLRFAKAYGMANTSTGTKVTTETLFQAGSISKPLAALGALKLVEEGKVDLDTDINTYLKTWQLPSNQFTETQKVTLRHLLTHTAGTTVHGFPGYAQSEKIPTTAGVLQGKGNTDKISVDTTPGTNWRYSGGGYTLMELLVEDITGMELNEYVDAEILSPLGMTNSTYAQPLPEDKHDMASAAYNGDGQIVKGYWNNYPEQAAAGLWTTPTDLAKYYMAMQEIFAGKRKGPLNQATVKAMLTKHKNNWGLGPGLNKEGDSLLFGHGGKNEGFSNNMMGFVHKGDAMIVMTNGDRGTQIMQEIMASISACYQWDIANPRVIKTIPTTIAMLEPLIGNYKSVRQLLPSGDYIVELKIVDGVLTVFDKSDNEVIPFVALEELKFMEMKTGNTIEFKQEEDNTVNSLMYNGQLEFVKVK